MQSNARQKFFRTGGSVSSGSFFVSAADYGCFCADFVIKEKLPVCKGERESLILERG